MKKQLGVMTFAVAATLLFGQEAKANSCVVEAGPIWGDYDAQDKCPATCSDNGFASWTGQWWTTVWGQMSVCECQAKRTVVEAGPIWGDYDAPGKCSSTCSANNGTWTGQWWTTVWGEMSVCECSLSDQC